MQKLLLYILVSLLFVSQSFADTTWDTTVASFLVNKWIIADSSDYNLDSNITRREMLKVMMNLSWKEVINTCKWIFQDLIETDWWCKYAEAALKNWYIAANDNFRPDDSVTNIEALKMIIQSRWLEVSEYNSWTWEKIQDWRYKYEQTAYFNNLLWEWWELNVWTNSFEYGYYIARGDVFIISARTYWDFLLNTDFWKTFTYSDWSWSVKYPENWIYKEWWSVNAVNFWPKQSNGLDAFFIRSSDTSYEDLIQEAWSLWSQWNIISRIEKEIFNLYGENGTMITTTAEQWWRDYTFITVVVKWVDEGTNYIISWDKDYVESFFQTFQIGRIQEIILEDTYSIQVPQTFTVDWLKASSDNYRSHSYQYNEIITNGIVIWLSRWGIVDPTLYDSKNAAEFFYDGSKKCSNCNVDNYAKIVEHDGIHFSLDKIVTNISDGHFAWILDTEIGDEITYRAATVIDMKQIGISLTYIDNISESEKKEIQWLFESIFYSFSQK